MMSFSVPCVRHCGHEFSQNSTLETLEYTDSFWYSELQDCQLSPCRYHGYSANRYALQYCKVNIIILGVIKPRHLCWADFYDAHLCTCL